MFNSGVKYFLVCAVFCSFASSDNEKLLTVLQDFENIKSLKYSSVNMNEANPMNPFLYKTANKYLCHYSKIDNPEMLIYGTKSWTFPRQTVTLNLTYPTQEKTRYLESHIETGNYIITGFDVLLLADTVGTRGYITSGGLLMDTISLSFECNNVTSLSYEFWLYGLPRDTPRVAEYSTWDPNYDQNDMC